MSGVAPSAVFTEWCRSFEALPSRMRDSGGIVIPPDVRLAGDALRERELTSDRHRQEYY